MINNAEIQEMGIPAVNRTRPLQEIQLRQERRRVVRAARERAEEERAALAALESDSEFIPNLEDGEEADVEMSDSAYEDGSTTTDDDDDASIRANADDENEVTMSGTDDDKSTVTGGEDEGTVEDDSDDETVVPDREDNDLPVAEEELNVADEELDVADEEPIVINDTASVESTPPRPPHPTTGGLSLPVRGNAITQDLVLPSRIFAAESGKPYDRYWMSKYHVSMRDIDRAMNGGVSKYKLVELVTHGVIKEEDRLHVKYKRRALYPGEDYDEDDVYEATVSAIDRRISISQLTSPCISLTNSSALDQILSGFRDKTSKKNYPDIRIAPDGDPAGGVVYDCQGPKALIDEIAVKLGHPASITKGWKGVWLIDREDENLGDLHSIRQAYHAFREQMEAYEKAHGQEVTRSRAVKHDRPSTQLPSRRR